MKIHRFNYFLTFAYWLHVSYIPKILRFSFEPALPTPARFPEESIPLFQFPKVFISSIDFSSHSFIFTIPCQNISDINGKLPRITIVHALFHNSHKIGHQLFFDIFRESGKRKISF